MPGLGPTTGGGSFAMGPRVQKAPGGAWHVYPGGHKVFVPHPAITPGQRLPGGGPTTYQGGMWGGPGTFAHVGQEIAGMQKPAGPAGQAAPSAQAATPANADFRDPAYFAALAGQTESANDQIANLQSSKQYGQQDYQEAIRRIAESQPQQEQGIANRANSQGLFYSGQMGQQLGNYRTQLAEKRADLGTRNQRAQDLADSQIAHIGRQLDAERQGDAADALGRSSNADQQAANQNTLAPDVTITPASQSGGSATAAAAAQNTARRPSMPPAPAGERPRIVVRGGHVYHTYRNGRVVRVR